MDILSQLSERELINLLFTSNGKRYLTLHRSLQSSILHRLRDDEDQERRSLVFSRAFLLLRGLMPCKAQFEIFTYEASPAFQKYLPQVLSLFDSTQKPLPPLGETVEFAALLSQAGTFVWENGYSTDC